MCSVLTTSVALRAIATTSVASKKQIEDAKAVKEAAELEQASLAVHETPPETAPTAPAETGRADWEDEAFAESAGLQSIVDRLDAKGEKEINRIIKVSLPTERVLMDRVSNTTVDSPIHSPL